MTVDLFSPSALKEYLKKNRIFLTRRYGQNFLVDRNMAGAIVRRMDLGSGDTVFEIGPGLGTMTALFLRETGNVISCEIDKGLHRLLLELHGSGGRLTAYHADFLKFDADDGLPARFTVYSSLPYAAAARILEKLAVLSDRITKLGVLLPEDMVQRLTAAPGSAAYGLFSIFLNTFFEVREASLKVGRRLFFPVPKVDSRFVLLIPRQDSARLVRQASAFMRFLSAVFQKRRKLLRRTLEGLLPGDEKEKVAILFGRYDIPDTVRPENIGGEMFVRFFDLYGGRPRGTNGAP